MSKKGFVRSARVAAPSVPPARVVVAPPLALPEREPRNILLMIALPALLVGIIGTLVVMYTSGVRSLQSGFFPLIGLVGFGALMFSGRFGRGRRISWGEQEKQRRMYLRQLDEDRDEVQRAAQEQRRSQLFVHGDPQELDTIIGGPRMWERRPSDADFLDVRLGIGVQSTADSAVSLQWPEVPVGEELEPVTGRALRDFILEQSKIRGIGKVLSLRSKPGFSFVSEDPAELHAFMRAVLCSLAVYHSPSDIKLMVVTRHPELWSWLVWLPHNQHDEMFDACGMRRLVFTSPTELEDALDSELHRKGRGPWTPPSGSSPTTMLSPIEAAAAGSALGPHWVIVDDNVGTPEQWEGVTGQKGMAGITVLRLATRPGIGVGFSDDDERFELREGRLNHRKAFYAVADMLAESTADRYARALARWSPMTAGELSETDSQGGELLRALGITDPRRLDVDRLWAESRGRGDPRWAMIPVGVKPGGELQHVILRAKDFGGFGFHSVVIGTSGSGKSEYFLSLCNGIALTHSPETFNVIFVDMKFESAAQDLEGLPHVAGSLSNLGKDDRHLAERMRKAIDGEIARRYRLFKDAGARDANEYEEMRLAGRDLEPVPILLVIIDEYLELFHNHPEWIDLVIHIGQEGRGCNVFFTLGGQRLDLSSLSKAKSNIAFRVALRAETAEDSRDVIGSDAALHLPSKENGYALLKVGPRDLEQFRCFYVSAPFVVPKKQVATDTTVDVSFTQPRPLTWEYQPLSVEDSAALATADAPEEPDEFVYHADGFKKKKLLDVIRESLVSHPARAPHQIWLPPLEVSETADALVQRWRGKPWWSDYGQNPGLVFPVGIEDFPEDHAQRVHAIDAEMDAARRSARHRKDHHRRGIGQDLRRTRHRPPPRDHRGQTRRFLRRTHRIIGSEDQRADQSVAGPDPVHGRVLQPRRAPPRRSARHDRDGSRQPAAGGTRGAPLRLLLHRCRLREGSRRVPHREPGFGRPIQPQAAVRVLQPRRDRRDRGPLRPTPRHRHRPRRRCGAQRRLPQSARLPGSRWHARHRCHAERPVRAQRRRTRRTAAGLPGGRTEPDQPGIGDRRRSGDAAHPGHRGCRHGRMCGKARAGGTVNSYRRHSAA